MTTSCGTITTSRAGRGPLGQGPPVSSPYGAARPRMRACLTAEAPHWMRTRLITEAPPPPGKRLAAAHRTARTREPIPVTHHPMRPTVARLPSRRKTEPIVITRLTAAAERRTSMRTKAGRRKTKPQTKTEMRMAANLKSAFPRDGQPGARPMTSLAARDRATIPQTDAPTAARRPPAEENAADTNFDHRQVRIHNEKISLYHTYTLPLRVSVRLRRRRLWSKGRADAR